MKLSAADMFRKVPGDLAQRTGSGGVLSLVALLVMGVLVLVETATYLSGRVESALGLDENTAPTIPFTFDVTVFAVPCQYASVDVYDFVGTRALDIRKNIVKREVGGHDGQADLGHWSEPKERAEDEDGDDPPHVHGYGAGDPDAVGSMELDAGKFYPTLSSGPVWAFVNFHAPWCPYCKNLAPVWEAFAAEVKKRGVQVRIVKVNCVDNAKLCREQQVMGYPTLRLYKMGKPVGRDYMGMRWIDNMLKYIEETTGETENARQVTRTAPSPMKSHATTGCRLIGHLRLNRVPGSIRIHAKSDAHSFDAMSTNISHSVRTMAFGDLHTKAQVSRALPRHYPGQFSPLNGKIFSTPADRQGVSHYLKIVSTEYRSRSYFRAPQVVYQMVPSSHVFVEEENAVPEVKITYDLSSNAIILSDRNARQWYEFLTNLCGLVGGMYTVFSLIDKSVFHLKAQPKQN